jgi:hypothetical protein
MYPEFFVLPQDRFPLQRSQFDMVVTNCQLELTSRMQSELLTQLLWQNQTPRPIDREQFFHGIIDTIFQREWQERAAELPSTKNDSEYSNRSFFADTMGETGKRCELQRGAARTANGPMRCSFPVFLAS